MALRLSLMWLGLVLAGGLLGGCGEPEGMTASTDPAAAENAKALKEALRDARRHPTEVPVLVKLGKVQYQQGLYNDAYVTLHKATRLDPGNVEAMLALTHVNSRLMNIPEGLEWAVKARQLAPDNPEAVSLHGSLLLTSGRTAEALKVLQRAAELWPNDTAVWMNLSVAHRLQGNLDEAAQAALRGARLKPNDSNVRYAFGDRLFAAGHTKEAEAEFRAAVQLDAENSQALVGLARLLIARNGDLEEARDFAVRAAQVHGVNYADAGVVAAWVLHLQDKDPEAAAELYALLKANPQHREGWEKYAVILKALGKTEDAQHAEEMAKRFL